jgi:hypothetical protein
MYFMFKGKVSTVLKYRTMKMYVGMKVESNALLTLTIQCNCDRKV